MINACLMLNFFEKKLKVQLTTTHLNYTGISLIKRGIPLYRGYDNDSPNPICDHRIRSTKSIVTLYNYDLPFIRQIVADPEIGKCFRLQEATFRAKNKDCLLLNSYL